MVAVAQLVELSVVVRAVAGSNPVSHPVMKKNSLHKEFFFVTMVFYCLGSNRRTNVYTERSDNVNVDLDRRERRTLSATNTKEVQCLSHYTSWYYWSPVIKYYICLLLEDFHCSLSANWRIVALTKPTVSCTSSTGKHPVSPTPFLVQVLTTHQNKKDLGRT